ncbi:MAG: hypothetical protein HY237_05435 [Acidobacteria bacterium]|nr:hypothetical protein [Acidobacteriota bacterium]
MKKLKRLLLRLWREQLGQDLVEYVLVGTLIALFAAASIQKVSNGINKVYSNSTSTLKNAAGGGGGGDDGDKKK